MRQIKISFYLMVILFTCSLSLSLAEYYSSIDAMHKLAKAEAELVKIYRQYLNKQHDEIIKYRNFLASVKPEYLLALDSAEDYLGNALNAFKTIKRNVIEWNHLNEFVKESPALQELNNTLSALQQRIAFPDLRDLQGAVNGLARMQEVYRLSVTDLKDGILNGTFYGTKLNWRDCFLIGANLFDVQNFAQAVDWLELTLQLITIEQSEKFDYKDYTIDDDDDRAIESLPMKESDDREPINAAVSLHSLLQTLEYLALSHYKMGVFDKALAHMEHILRLSPQHSIRAMHDFILSGNPPVKVPIDRSAQIDWYANYTRLCRGILLPEERKPNLKCKLDTKGQAYFVLAPLKIEELSIEPEIALYHDFLSDGQIDDLIKQAKAKGLFRSLWDKGVNDTRISQQAWLNYNTPTTRMIYQLAGDVSGLDMRNSEILQVANYGIGGQFEAHCDTLGYSEERAKYWVGDRMATLMFYLSNVDQGGYTIYPNINMFVRPTKGALLMWYNMHRTLDEDFRTMHAGCPLLKGIKRISNIWIHSGYQEFRRPCELKSDNYKSYGYTCNE